MKANRALFFRLLARLTQAALLAVAVAACGPKLQLSPGYTPRPVTRVALLPYAVPPGMQREKAAYLHRVLQLELQNDGYVLLDPQIIGSHCSGMQCRGLEDLSKEYDVEGFFKLSLDSDSRLNFLLGYYNTIEGVLAFSEIPETEVFHIEHTQRERGGVLFDSGQIIQGVIAQIRNADEESARKKLSSKFIRTVVSEIPSELVVDRADYSGNVEIFSASAQELKASVSKICLQGSPGGLAHLIVDGRRSTLRETSAGRYCGIFRFDASLLGEMVPRLELRSPYGSSVSRPFPAEAIRAQREVRFGKTNMAMERGL